MTNQDIQNFFYEDNFFSDLYELCEYNDWDKEEIDTFSDDFTIDVYEGNLEPIFQLSSKWITECIDEFRF